MSSNRRLLRERLQRACGEPVACIPAPAPGDPALPWSTYTTGEPQGTLPPEGDQPGIAFPWTLPEGLLLWQPDWGCRWIVQQGVSLPPPEESAARKLRRLRIDPPQGNAPSHHLPVPDANLSQRPRPPQAADQDKEHSPAGSASLASRPDKPEPEENTPSPLQQAALLPQPPTCAEETAAGIPQLYLELAQAWRKHPRWQSPVAALLCPVDPAQHSLHELAIHLAGALAHLEKSETLVVDFRPQATSGPWQRSGSGLGELLDAAQPPEWETLLRSTAYQRVWYLPRGRRRKNPHRRHGNASRWPQLLRSWNRRFATVLILGPQPGALAPEQIPSGEVLYCLLAVVEASSRQAVLVAKQRVEELTGTLPLCFALPDPSWEAASPTRAA